MDEEKALREAEENAARHMIEFGKSSLTAPTEEQRAAVEDCMEKAGCNDIPRSREISRRIQGYFILRYCIMPCDRAELRKIESAILEIAAETPQLWK